MKDALVPEGMMVQGIISLSRCGTVGAFALSKSDMFLHLFKYVNLVIVELA